MPPALEAPLGFQQRVELLGSSNSSRSLPLKLSTYPFSQGLPGSINSVATPTRAHHWYTFVPLNSELLSIRIFSGTLRQMNRSLSPDFAPPSALCELPPIG